jgi:hypothetical protein
MDSHFHGNHLSKIFSLGKTFLILRGFGMSISRRIFIWSQRRKIRMVKRNYLYLVSQIRVKVKEPTRVRERVRSQPHIQERRT